MVALVALPGSVIAASPVVPHRRDAAASIQAFHGRTAHAIAYDAARHTIVLFGGTDGGDAYPSSTWGWSDGSWTLLANVGPPGREDALLAWDGKRSRVVLYGGRSIGPGRTVRVLTDTWAWDGTRWTQLDTIGPGPREHAAMAWDAAHDRIVINGGFDPVADVPRRDTWAFDGERWRPLDAQLPPDHFANAMVYDSAAGRVVMSVIVPSEDGPNDGKVASRILGLTDGGWVSIGDGPRFSPHAPIARGTAGQLVFFAGFEPPDTTAVTWLADGAVWRRYLGAGPGRRRGTAMALDSDRGRIILIGGDDGARILADVWEWDGVAWRRVPDRQ